MYTKEYAHCFIVFCLIWVFEFWCICDSLFISFRIGSHTVEVMWQDIWILYVYLMFCNTCLTPLLQIWLDILSFVKACSISLFSDKFLTWIFVFSSPSLTTEADHPKWLLVPMLSQISCNMFTIWYFYSIAFWESCGLKWNIIFHQL